MGFDASLTVSLGNSNPVLYNLELNTASATDIIKVTQKNRFVYSIHEIYYKITKYILL